MADLIVGPGVARPIRGRFHVNLALFMVFAVSLSVWLLHYTDSFEAVGGILAIAGALSWLGFVSKVLPDELLKRFQWKFVDLFEAGWLSLPIAGLFLVWGALSLFAGSVRVELQGQNVSQYAFIYPNGSDQMGDQVALSPVSPTHILKWARPWSGSAYRMRIPGFASQTVTLYPWWLTIIHVPNFFNRKIFLVRASRNLLPSIGSAKIVLQVSILDKSDREVRSEVVRDYTGYSFWVNCTSDVEIPARKQAEIESDFPPGAPLGKFRALWLSPKAPLRWGDLDLEPGSKIKIAQVVKREDERVFDHEPVSVPQEGPSDTAVEVITLDLIKQ